jgi:hypothetical protein
MAKERKEKLQLPPYKLVIRTAIGLIPVIIA